MWLDHKPRQGISRILTGAKRQDLSFITNKTPQSPETTRLRENLHILGESESPPNNGSQKHIVKPSDFTFR